MAQNFIECDREQLLLMSPSLREWLPENHLAWFVIDAVRDMDLSAFYARYRQDGWGRAAYDPAMMGWIQLVLATPNVEELRWPRKAVLQIVPLQQGRVPGDVRLLGAENIGSVFGQRSLEGHQASTLPRRRVCCRALVSGGSARVAGCRFSRSRRCLGVICPSPSG